MTTFERFLKLKNEGRFQEINALIPYTAFVNIELIGDTSNLQTVLRQTESNTGNPTIPAVHGGVVGGLLEHTAILKVLIEGEYTRFPKIINLSVEYLRPCLATKDTFARGNLFKQGRSVTNVRIEAWQSDEAKPVAAAHAHFLVG
jgi:acyl-coenzyme A thioesterase PaaI-like protein